MNRYANITASALIKSGQGRVRGFVVNSHTSGTLKLWDSLTATGTVIINTYTFPAGSSIHNIIEGVSFNVGLYATIGGTADITLLFK